MSNASHVTPRVAALLAATVLIVAACQGGATPSPTASLAPTASATAGASETPAATETPGPTETTSGEVYTVNLGSGAMGSYLTGEDGKTLYVKQGDTTSATSCTGDCLTNWPPFTLESGETAEAGAGVTGTLGTFTRPEGDTQVTYGDKPLYYFAGDSQAGDTNGEGLAGVWSVAAP